MEFDFSTTDRPAATQTLALKTIYTVAADPSYDVPKGLAASESLIALRTLRGVGEIEFVDGSEQSLTADSLLLCPYDEIRRYRCTSDSWDFWWFEFRSEGDIGLPQRTLLPMIFSEQEAADCRRALDLLKVGSESTLAAASALVGYLLQDWRCRIAGTSTRLAPHRHAIADLLESLRRSDVPVLSVADMARQVGLGERRFRQVFESAVGCAPKRYMVSLQMQRAEELLRNTPFSIGAIAERLGYQNAFHFSREFSKHAGVPPSRFRRGEGERR